MESHRAEQNALRGAGLGRTLLKGLGQPHAQVSSQSQRGAVRLLPPAEILIMGTDGYWVSYLSVSYLHFAGGWGGSVQTEPKAVRPSAQRMWTWASGSVHYKLLFSPVLYCTSPTGTGGRHGLNRRSVPRGAAASGAWVPPRRPGWADLVGASLRHPAAVALWAGRPLWNPDFSSAECGWKQACLTGRREDKKRGGCGLLLSLNGWRAFSIQKKF